jgi:hypothetical protein
MGAALLEERVHIAQQITAPTNDPLNGSKFSRMVYYNPEDDTHVKFVTNQLRLHVLTYAYPFSAICLKSNWTRQNP